MGANGVLDVTISQKFLDEAVYPVTIDPTFGVTTIGGTAGANVNDNAIAVLEATLSENGDVSKLTKYDGGNSGSNNHKAVIYSDDGTNPNALQGIGSETSLPTTNQWNDLSFSAVVSLTTGNWYIGWVSETSNGFAYAYDAGGDYNFIDSTPGGYYASPPNPFPAHTSFDRKVSIYATYTASGGATVSPKVLINTGQVIINTGTVVIP